MKIYFLLWEGLPCDESGFITARVKRGNLEWMEELRTAMWDSPDEPLAFIKKLKYKGSYSVYEVEV